MLTLFIRGMLCNWMVCVGVIAAMMSTSVTGKVIAMWLPIMVFFYMGFEHSIVNMFLFPSGLLLGAQLARGDAEDPLDVFQEAEIQHLVGLVEDDDLQL